MNYRTLTDNPQATDLINAVKDLKPVKQHDKYQGSMEYLQADNASYAKLVAAYGPGQLVPEQAQPRDLQGYVAFMVGVLILLILIKKLRDSSK